MRKQTADFHLHANSGYETLKLSLELLQQLHLEQRYQKRLNELFEYYVIDSASAINWEQFGQVQQAQSGMRHVLEKLLNQVVVAHTDQLVQTERALGVAEGAMALMIQTGASRKKRTDYCPSSKERFAHQQRQFGILCLLAGKGGRASPATNVARPRRKYC